MIRPIIHASLLVALATPVAATPPDFMEARATLLCTGGDELAFLMRTQGNHGSHFISASHVAVVKLDAEAGSWTYVPHGTVVSNNLDELEGSGGLKTTYDLPDAAPPVAGSLRDWGLGPCWIRDRQHWYAAGQPRRFEYRFTLSRDGAMPVFALGLGDETRAVAATYGDPRGEYYDADKRYPAGVVPVGERGLELYGDPDTERVEVLAELHLETRVVLHLRVTHEMGMTEAFAMVDKAALVQARAYLINNAGLQRHRAKAYDEASDWFGAALREDPTHRTARFNLACAEARRGRVSAAIDALRQLPQDKALKKRIAGDGDFDGIRGDSAFKAYVREL